MTGTGVPCCGMAGDRGMRYPELTGSALQHLKLPEGCTDGYSTRYTADRLPCHAVQLPGIVANTTSLEAATAVLQQRVMRKLCCL